MALELLSAEVDAIQSKDVQRRAVPTGPWQEEKVIMDAASRLEKKTEVLTSPE